MQLSTFLSQSRTLHNASDKSKKSALEHAAELVAEDLHHHEPVELFNRLVERERLGSTGIGNGVAIPHCRMEHCDKVLGSLIKLSEPIDYDAIDDEPVDILFILVVPKEANDEHLQILATLAEKFSDEGFLNKLRTSCDNLSLYQAATS